MLISYEIKMIEQPPGHEDRVWQVAWMPGKPILASCSADKTVRIYALQDDYTVLVLSSISTGHQRAIRSVAWAPSGMNLATASFDSTVTIWGNTDSGHNKSHSIYAHGGEWECMSTLEGHENECKCVAYSSTGALLATCSRDKSVWIWEVQPNSDFECLSVLMEHSQDVKCVAWHPHEEILASASYDNCIKLYSDDPEDDWYSSASLTGHTSTVWCVCFSPCGGYLASCSEDMTIRIWRRVPTSQYPVDGEWIPASILKGHDGPVFSIGWCAASPIRYMDDEKQKALGRIASVSGDGHIYAWEIYESEGVITYRIIAQMFAAHGEADVNSVAWCTAGKFQDVLATAGDDGNVRIWRVTEVTHI